jgi:aspartokinase-like uncharacterized kinase
LFLRLEALLRSEPGRPLLVSGGGGAADVVREWDRVHRLGDERAHRLAVKSLRLGEAFLADGLAGAVIAESRADAAAAWAAGRVPVLCAGRFLDAEEPTAAEPLPRCWDVTSDSIAAWVSARWPADLVLLKSTTPDAAAELFVDPYFVKLIGRVRRAEWIDLRGGRRGRFTPAVWPSDSFPPVGPSLQS